MSNLVLCANQEKNNKPYEFKMTKIKVYSLEEAQYHCFHYWKQSLGEFHEEEFIAWIQSTLGLPKLPAAELKKIEQDNDAGTYQKLSAFLSMADYFPYLPRNEGLSKLKTEIDLWESRQKWEMFKERGDYWAMNNGDFERGLVFYNQGLAFEENIPLLNNAGVAQLKLGRFAEAAEFFKRARHLEPQNINLRLNMIEALIFDENHDQALALIQETSALISDVPDSPENAELMYFLAELDFGAKNYSGAIKRLNRALEMHYESAYIYRLCDCYVKTRLYDKALSALESVRLKDAEFLQKQADILATAKNFPQAVKCIERALVYDSENIRLWTLLAQYSRQDYNIEKASGAILKAISIDPDNPKALLEQARIRKAQGRTRNYQSILGKVLLGFKRSYRDIANLKNSDSSVSDYPSVIQ
ncbi:MAG: tetratricopeptide repeat protein [Defluviitaleaceae bacterium]|nr:tetratricopeptide repeat protein [Defluviitaleaceae bacterium]